VGERKHEVERPYPPDYVSAETLAYRLDLSRTTVDSYVRAGLLPKPEMIGNLPRWDFAQVVAFIKARNDAAAAAVASHEDEYLKGIRRGATAQG
jgi:predicted DNA-binding transcriptional regulator AlpA